MSHVLPRRLAALLVLAVSLLGLLAGPASADRGPVLTGHEQRVVLDLIDDACGDTWCEGDFRFDFRTFTCARAQQTCTLGLRLAPYTDGPAHWYWRWGKVTGFVRFPQMVSTSATGAQALTPAFYDAVNTLVNDVEATVPPVPPAGEAAAAPGREGGR